MGPPGGGRRVNVAPEDVEVALWGGGGPLLAGGRVVVVLVWAGPGE